MPTLSKKKKKKKKEKRFFPKDNIFHQKTVKNHNALVKGYMLWNFVLLTKKVVYMYQCVK